MQQNTQVSLLITKPDKWFVCLLCSFYNTLTHNIMDTIFSRLFSCCLDPTLIVTELTAWHSNVCEEVESLHLSEHTVGSFCKTCRIKQHTKIIRRKTAGSITNKLIKNFRCWVQCLVVCLYLSSP